MGETGTKVSGTDPPTRAPSAGASSIRTANGQDEERLSTSTSQGTERHQVNPLATPISKWLRMNSKQLRSQSAGKPGFRF